MIRTDHPDGSITFEDDGADEWTPCKRCGVLLETCVPDPICIECVSSRDFQMVLAAIDFADCTDVQS